MPKRIKDKNRSFYVRGYFVLNVREKPWFASYPNGACLIESLGEETLPSMLRKSASRFLRRPALTFMGRTVNYTDLYMQMNQLAHALVSLGIKKGDRVAILLPNCPQAVIAYFAILAAGGIAVPCNPRYTLRELQEQLSDAGVNTVIASDLSYELVREIAAEHVIVTSLSDFLPAHLKIPYWLKHARVANRELCTKKIIRWKHIFSEPYKIGWMTHGFPKINPEDTAVLQYTGGTTGTPKGAELTHRNLVSNIAQCRLHFPDIEEGSEVFLGVIPFFHVFGQTVLQNTGLAVGAHIVLIPDPKNTNAIMRSIRKYRPTLTGIVPLLARRIESRLDPLAFSSFKYIISGAAEMPEEIFYAFLEKSGIRICEGYGLSEASPVTHCNDPRNPKPNSIGFPFPATEAKLVAEDGNEILGRNDGELWVRGPQVMKGYWNKSDETSQVLTPDGWLKTGDIMRKSEDGSFSFVGRKKEMIRGPGGETIWPQEIEKVLLGHSAVEDAVVQVEINPDHSYNLTAVIVLKKEAAALPDGLIATRLFDYFRENLAPYKHPNSIDFRSELPKTILGKPKRILTPQKPV